MAIPYPSSFWGSWRERDPPRVDVWFIGQFVSLIFVKAVMMISANRSLTIAPTTTNAAVVMLLKAAATIGLPRILLLQLLLLLATYF